MPTLAIHTKPPPPTYNRATRKLHARPLRFELDGWPLLAESLAEARREVEVMGEAIERIEPEH